jgi:class 3 adenylate cyclase
MTVTSGEGTTQPASRAQTRGFLFADIRGYTRFVERRGAAAAADLLLRYRAIVRQAIEGHAGAEIRTEGDSFYVVLQSASDAVRCGLSIVEGVAAANRAHPDDPIRVGVGIHAGEAIETQEGLVGTAVNVAARVCALAGPGEVLVTDTVRSLTRSVIPVSFTSRGQHRLKGLGDAVALYVVTAADSPTAGVRRRALIAIALLAFAVVVIAAVVHLRASGLPAAESTTSPSTTGSSTAIGSPTTGVGTPTPPELTVSPSAMPSSTLAQLDLTLAAGTHLLPRFQPQIELTIEPSWRDRVWSAGDSNADDSAVAAISPGFEPPLTNTQKFTTNRFWLEVQFLRLRTVRSDPCQPANDQSRILGRDPQDFFDWLSADSLVTISNLQGAAIGSWSGLQMDARITGDAGAVCAQVPGTPRAIWLFDTSLGAAQWWPWQWSHFVVLDVGESVPLVIWLKGHPTGNEQVFVPGGGPGSAPSMREIDWQTMSIWGDDLLGKLSIEPSASP